VPEMLQTEQFLGYLFRKYSRISKNMFAMKTVTDGWVVTRHDEFNPAKDMLANGLPFSMVPCYRNGMVNKFSFEYPDKKINTLSAKETSKHHTAIINHSLY
jgi:hypothetical protein